MKKDLKELILTCIHSESVRSAYGELKGIILEAKENEFKLVMAIRDLKRDVNDGRPLRGTCRRCD
jgi:hypothetical protein